jgi:two-component system, NtrC family, sensor kinase
MNTSTRLILILTVVVGTVMGAAGYLLVKRQESVLMAQRRNEVLAHAITLQIALDNDYSAGRTEDAKVLIDRLSENPKIEGVVLYDERGEVLMLSDPLVAAQVGPSAHAAHVVETGTMAERIRSLDGREFFAVAMPLDLGGGKKGAFEIIEVMTFVKADIARARLGIAMTTLLLFMTIFAVVFLVTRRSLSRPIESLLAGARALGRGDLGHRVVVPVGSNEFVQLAHEFNRMADRLEEQRKAASREAEERIALEREMRHGERLALVGRLAAGVAHEMGAPLNVIDGRAEQILERSDAPLEMRQRNLTIIRTQTRRIAAIVRQLLDLARPYHLRREAVDASGAAAGACDLVETEAASTGVTIDLLASEPVYVDADENLLQQVLLNVCLNAVQAMPHGGRLLVEVVPDAGSGCAAIRVADTGPGIPPEHLVNVFDPFFTTKDVGRGTGLGLTVSRRIVEEHGGRIEASNAPEGGAVFTVYLPRSAAAPDTPADRVAETARRA